MCILIGGKTMFTAAGFAKALAYWKLFLQGVVCTVCLSFLTVLFGFLLALLITESLPFMTPIAEPATS